MPIENNNRGHQSSQLLRYLGFTLILGTTLFFAKNIIIGSGDYDRDAFALLFQILMLIAGIGIAKCQKWSVYLFFISYGIGSAFYILLPRELFLPDSLDIRPIILWLTIRPVPWPIVFAVPVAVAAILWSSRNAIE